MPSKLKNYSPPSNKRHTTMHRTEDTTWRLISRLSYAGMAPFVLLAFLLWLVDADLHPFIALAMAGYGAVIVSFLGGIHWGIGFRNAITSHNAPPVHFVWGVIAPLLAWVAIMMPPFAGLPLLGAVLIACYFMDRRTWPAAGLGVWMTLRLQLTAVSALSCFFAAGAT
jgi:hypothetical protein